MNPNTFCGADTIEEYEVMVRLEPVVIDTEMIERGDGPLFSSIYDRRFLKGKKSKAVQQKTDAEIVEDIFKSKLKPKEKKTQKKGLSSILRGKVQTVSPSVVRTSVGSQKQSEVAFIISLFC